MLLSNLKALVTHNVLLLKARSLVINQRKFSFLITKYKEEKSEYKFKDHFSFIKKLAFIGLCSFVFVYSNDDLKIKFYNLSVLNAKVNNDEFIINKPKKNLNIKQSFNFIADAAEKAIPSVVQIVVYETDPYFGNQIKISSGSGFLINSNGLILTNAHVISNHKKVHVELQDGSKYVGYVQCKDNFIDLATIKINEKNLPYLELEKNENLRVGEFVVAIGYPFSLNNTVTSGIISSISLTGKEIGLPNDDMKYIQTDASINIGNSGGPLIDLNGNVIGINTYKVVSGIHLAIPSNYALKFLEKAKNYTQSKETSNQKKRQIGVTMLSLTEEVLSQIKEKIKLDHVKNGVLLVKVIKNSPADRAGLQTGDVIIEINSKKVTVINDILNETEKNSSNKITLLRGSQKITLVLNFD